MPRPRAQINAYHKGLACIECASAQSLEREHGVNEFIAGLMRWMLRLAVFAMGAVLFLMLLAAVLALGLLWSLRALWARLTGQPVVPWAMRMDPRAGWSTVYRSTARWTAQTAPGSGAARSAPRLHDVTDVQPREVR